MYVCMCNMYKYIDIYTYTDIYTVCTFVHHSGADIFRWSTRSRITIRILRYAFCMADHWNCDLPSYEPSWEQPRDTGII